MSEYEISLVNQPQWLVSHEVVHLVESKAEKRRGWLAAVGEARQSNTIKVGRPGRS